jgi:hypothetical protein
MNAVLDGGGEGRGGGRGLGQDRSAARWMLNTASARE